MMIRRSTFLVRLSLCALASAAMSLDATAAELSWAWAKSSGNGFREMRVEFRLRPAPGETVAALQFDFSLDRSSELMSADVGDAAKEASKSITFNEIEPGRVRVIIAGLNRNAIGAGTVATLTYRMEPSFVSSGAGNLERVILSDPFGSAVPVRVATSTSDTAVSAMSSNFSSTAPGLAWAIAAMVSAILVGVTIAAMRPARKGKIS